MISRFGIRLAALSILFICATTSVKADVRGTVATEYFFSEVLRTNKVGLELRRSVTVYLPPGYHESNRSYPVIYFLHSLGWSNERMFAHENPPQRVLDRAIARGTMGEFIFVAADYSSPTLGSWYENSTTSGLWLDYTTNEVVPLVESRFRTIRHRDSRGVAGEFIGGYGALKLAMLHPDLFGAVYALHPVGTGSGLMPMHSMLDWTKLHAAKKFDDLWSVDHYAPGFVAMAQAYLPNPARPPFYCDFVVEMEDGKTVFKPDNFEKLQSNFFLDQLLRQHADNFRKLHGIAFDWGRYDRTQSHVYSNQAFTRMLDDLGIEHTAEEYNGDQHSKNWIEHGRVEDRMLPFFARHLRFGTH